MFWHMPTAAARGALDRRFAALPRPYFARARAYSPAIVSLPQTGSPVAPEFAQLVFTTTPRAVKTGSVVKIIIILRKSRRSDRGDPVPLLQR